VNETDNPEACQRNIPGFCGLRIIKKLNLIKRLIPVCKLNQRVTSMQILLASVTFLWSGKNTQIPVRSKGYRSQLTGNIECRALFLNKQFLYRFFKIPDVIVHEPLFVYIYIYIYIYIYLKHIASSTVPVALKNNKFNASQGRKYWGWICANCCQLIL